MKRYAHIKNVWAYLFLNIDNVLLTQMKVFYNNKKNFIKQ